VISLGDDIVVDDSNEIKKRFIVINFSEEDIRATFEYKDEDGITNVVDVRNTSRVV